MKNKAEITRRTQAKYKGLLPGWRNERIFFSAGSGFEGLSGTLPPKLPLTASTPGSLPSSN